MWNARSGALWFAVTLCTVNLSACNTACNTVEGFGTDMQNLGQKIARKINQKDSSDATGQEVRLEVDREARTEPKEGQKASLTVPATGQVVERKSSEHRENQEREGTPTMKWITLKMS